MYKVSRNNIFDISFSGVALLCIMKANFNLKIYIYKKNSRKIFLKI